MKVKSLAILAASGLLAATFSYAAPAGAEDAASPQDMQMQGMTADNAATSQGSNAMSNDTNANNTNSSTSSTTNSSSNNSTSTTTDENAPERDSATGDDDY